MSYLLAQTTTPYRSHRFSNMQPHYSQGNVQKALGAPRVCGNPSGLTLSWLPASTAERPFCQHQEPGCWVWYCRPMRNIIRIQDGSLENRDILGSITRQQFKEHFRKFMIFSSWPGSTTDLQYSKFLSIVEHIIPKHLDRKGGPAEASMPKQRKKQARKYWGVYISSRAYTPLNFNTSSFVSRPFIHLFTECLLWDGHWAGDTKMKKSRKRVTTIFFSTTIIKEHVGEFSLQQPVWTHISIKEYPFIISNKVSNKCKYTSILGGSWTVRTSYFDLDFSFFFLFFLEASFCSGSSPCDALD